MFRSCGHTAEKQETCRKGRMHPFLRNKLLTLLRLHTTTTRCPRGTREPVWGHLVLLCPSLDIFSSSLRCKTHAVHLCAEPFFAYAVRTRGAAMPCYRPPVAILPGSRTPQSGSASLPGIGLMALHHCQETPLNPGSHSVSQYSHEL